MSATGSPNYIDANETQFGSGKAIDLVNGHVEVLTGETEDIFDGGNSFSTSAWVKGWPEKLAGPILSKGGLFNGPDSVPSLKLWLDAKNTSSMDQGTSLGASGPPSDGDNVKYWVDQSGNGHHATSSGSPTYEESAINGLPVVNTSGGTLEISNSASVFDAWDSMSLVFVYRWASGYWNWENNIKKGGAWEIGKARIENQHNQGIRWRNGDFRSNGITRANENPKIITFVYDGSAQSITWHSNGSMLVHDLDPALMFRQALVQTPKRLNFTTEINTVKF